MNRNRRNLKRTPWGRIAAIILILLLAAGGFVCFIKRDRVASESERIGTGKKGLQISSALTDQPEKRKLKKQRAKKTDELEKPVEEKKSDEVSKARVVMDPSIIPEAEKEVKRKPEPPSLQIIDEKGKILFQDK